MRCLHRLWRGFLLGCLATKLLLLLIPLLLLLLLFFSFFLSFFSFFSYFFVFLDLNEGQKLRNRDMFVKAALGSSFWLAWSLVSHWQVVGHPRCTEHWQIFHAPQNEQLLAPSWKYLVHQLYPDLKQTWAKWRFQKKKESAQSPMHSGKKTKMIDAIPKLRLRCCLRRSWTGFFRGLLLRMLLLNLLFRNSNQGS